MKLGRFPVKQPPSSSAAASAAKPTGRGWRDRTAGHATWRRPAHPGRVGERMRRPVASPVVISLDAATVLLQWAAGGMLFCWFTTRRREVGLGYGWMLRITYLFMAVSALACGIAFGAVPVREVASALAAAAILFALVVSIVRRKAGVTGQLAEHDRRTARVAAMTGIERTGLAADDAPPARGPEFPPVLDLVPALVALVGLVAAGLDAG